MTTNCGVQVKVVKYSCTMHVKGTEAELMKKAIHSLPVTASYKQTAVGVEKSQRTSFGSHLWLNGPNVYDKGDHPRKLARQWQSIVGT